MVKGEGYLRGYQKNIKATRILKNKEERAVDKKDSRLSD